MKNLKVCNKVCGKYNMRIVRKYLNVREKYESMWILLKCESMWKYVKEFECM